MNQLISSPDVARSAARWPAVSTSSPSAVADDSHVAAVSLAPAGDRSRQIRSMRYSTQLNEQLTSAQRALKFIEHLVHQLESLKAELSHELTQRHTNYEGLEAKIAGFAEQWDQHYVQSGGCIDSQLCFRLAADACQKFTIPGLDLESLSSGAAETLAFFTRAPRIAPLSVSVGNGARQADILQAFKRAFAPVGIEVSAYDNGELNFAVSEAEWPLLQQRLAARGEGIRFPAGQPQPVRVVAEPDVFSIVDWKVNERTAARHTLQRVVRAQEHLQRVRTSIVNAIDELQRSIQQLVRMDENNWANSFAADFNTRFNQPIAYRESYHIIPALLGISRYRVLSLLSLS